MDPLLFPKQLQSNAISNFWVILNELTLLLKSSRSTSVTGIKKWFSNNQPLNTSQFPVNCELIYKFLLKSYLRMILVREIIFGKLED